MKKIEYILLGLIVALIVWRALPEAPAPVNPPTAKSNARREESVAPAPTRTWTKEELVAHLKKSGGKLPESQHLTDSTIPHSVYLSAAEEASDDRLASQLLDNANPYRGKVISYLAEETQAAKEVRAVSDFFPRYQAQLKRLLGSKDPEVRLEGLKLLDKNAWAAPKGELYSTVLALASSKDDVIRAQALECLLSADIRVLDPTNLKLLGDSLVDPNVYIASQAAASFRGTRPSWSPSRNPLDVTNPKAHPFAVAGLQSPFPLVRAYSALILSWDDRIDYKLTPLLEDKEPCVRASAAMALAGNERALPSGQLTKMIVECPDENAEVALKAPKDYQTSTKETSKTFSPSDQSTLLEAYLAAFKQRHPDFNSSSRDPREQAKAVQIWWNTPDD